MFDDIEVPYGIESSIGEIGWEFNKDSIREAKLVTSYQPVRE